MNNYGENENTSSRFCPNCGSTLMTGQTFCSTCGTKLVDSANLYGKDETGMVSKRKKHCNAGMMLLGIVSGFLVTLAIAVLLWNSNIGKSEFEKKFPDIVYNSWCEVSKDGKTMTISGKATELTDKGYVAIFEVCNELGFRNVGELIGNNEDVGFENVKYSFTGDFKFQGDYVKYKAVFEIKE